MRAYSYHSHVFSVLVFRSFTLKPSDCSASAGFPLQNYPFLTNRIIFGGKERIESKSLQHPAVGRFFPFPLLVVTSIRHGLNSCVPPTESMIHTFSFLEITPNSSQELMRALGREEYKGCALGDVCVGRPQIHASDAYMDKTSSAHARSTQDC